MAAEAKYLKVARILQKRIEDGVYKPQTPLPDQKTLAEELHVSRLTVKKALDGLQRKGLVYKESGLGTFVLGPIPGISSNSEWSALFDLLSLWNVIANLCTSSCILVST